MSEFIDDKEGKIVINNPTYTFPDKVYCPRCKSTNIENINSRIYQDYPERFWGMLECKDCGLLFFQRCDKDE